VGRAGMPLPPESPHLQWKVTQGCRYDARRSPPMSRQKAAGNFAV